MSNNLPPQTNREFSVDQFRQYPVYWRNETTGVLAPAVEAFIQHNAYPVRYPHPTDEQLAVFRQYLKQHIDCPLYQDDENGTLKQLRQSVSTLQTVKEFRTWLETCLTINIDPL